MKILQLIYTSCKKGLSSGAGFQTFAMSEGITGEEKREIERYGLYVPPTNLPTQPSDEEIKTQFPVAFRFFRLESGRFAICQSKYIGRDYSGRYGNYFSHTLILEKDHFPFYPIQWYNSPLFRDQLIPDEIDLPATPPPLPGIELAEFTAALTIHFEDVTVFIEKNGMEPVKELLSAAISYHQYHRRLVLCDTQPSIPFWIAAVQMAFPLPLAHNLTFATYVHDPAGMNVMISGVPKTGSRFAFSETQRNYEYYIFNLAEPGTPVVETQYDYIKNVDLGYTVSPDSLQEYHRFITQFDFTSINQELDSIDALYRMARVGIADLPAARLTAAVEFAGQYASPPVLGQLSDTLQGLLPRLIPNVDFNSAGIVAKFLFKIARQTQEKKPLDTAYTFFLQALDHLILNFPQPDLDATHHFYTAIMDENLSYGEEFAKRILTVSRLKQINYSLSQNPRPLAIEIYFHLIVGTVISYRYTWSFMTENHPTFTSYIQFSAAQLANLPTNLNRVMIAAGKDKEFFAHFVSFCLRQQVVNERNQGIFLEGFIQALKNKPSETPAFIRTKLLQLGHGDFIYSEYIALLQRSQNRREFFQVYFETVFAKNIDFLNQYFSSAVDDYLEYLPEKDLFEACSSIIEYSDTINNDSVIKRVIEGFEKGLPLTVPGEKAFQKILLSAKIKKERKIATTPDITRLIMLGINFERAHAQLDNRGIKLTDLVKPTSPTFSLEKLDIKRASAYFSWCFPNLLRLVKSPNDHEILFQWFGAAKLDKTFVLDYISGIPPIIKESKEPGMDILLNFLKFYLATLGDDPQYFVIKEQAREKLIKILYKLSKPQFENIRAALSRSTVTNDPAVKREWVSILEGVTQNNKKSGFSIWARLFCRGKKAEDRAVNEKQFIDKQEKKKKTTRKKYRR